MPSLAERVIRHIAAFRPRFSQRLLDVIYGPQAKPLRTQIMAMILDHKVTGSDKAAQYGATREALLKLVGIENVHDRCIAEEDADFEKRAGNILEGRSSPAVEAAPTQSDKDFWVMWTYIANYGGPTKIVAKTPEAAIASVILGFSEDFAVKGKVYVWDHAPVLCSTPATRGI